MPPCGATEDENGVPPWKRGTSGGFWVAFTYPGAPRHPSERRDFQRRVQIRTTWIFHIATSLSSVCDSEPSLDQIDAD